MKYLKYAFYSVLLMMPEHLNAQSFTSYDPEKIIGSVGTFGGIGLLEMHNARFTEDGDLSVGFVYLNDGQNYYATWQATPWLETTLRYSKYDNSVSGVDKGLDLKIRLLEEGKYKPAIAIGLQDMLGDGLLSGEYIAFSKTIKNFDFTLGVGFGNLANRAQTRNIFRIFGNGFSQRNFSEPGSEKLRFGNYFSGQKMGFYGGLEYKTPFKGLTAKLEYSTIDKSKMAIFKDYKSKTAFNIGFNYKIKNWLEIGAGLMHGNQVALHLTARQNLKTANRYKLVKGPPLDEIRGRKIIYGDDSTQEYRPIDNSDHLFDRIRQMGYVIDDIELKGNSVYLNLDVAEGHFQDKIMVLGAVLDIYVEASLNFINDPRNNLKAMRNDMIGKMAIDRFRRSSFYSREIEFEELSDHDLQQLSYTIFDQLAHKELKPIDVKINRDEIIIEKNIGPYAEIPKNVGRVARLLTSMAPDTVERFTVLSSEDNIKVSQVSILRKDMEKLAEYNSSPEEIYAHAQVIKPNNDINGLISFKKFPDLEYGVFPDIVSHFGSTKNDHFKADLNLKLFANARISNDFTLYLEAKQHVIGDLDLIAPQTNNNIAAVRSDIGLYSAQGKSSISRLTLEYLKSLGSNIYTKISAGYLENMYAGVNAELLYRPYGRSISLGIDLNYVRQRAYEQLFKMRDYKTMTGHASLYYVNSKYDITSKISVGRYLAKDWGTTIDISRAFNNGVRIGARATFTNMSNSDFGQGSFDKGIYMTVPFDFFYFKQSRQTTQFNFRRLGKNGGQKIDHNRLLFDLLSAGQPYKIKNGWNQILN